MSDATKSGNNLTAETNNSSGAEYNLMQDRQSRKNTALRMKSWLMSKQGARQDLKDSFQFKEELQERSDSGSSEDLEEIQDENEKSAKKARDGQLIYLNVEIANQKKKQSIQATTLDDPAAVARKFAQKHNLGLTN